MIKDIRYMTATQKRERRDLLKKERNRLQEQIGRGIVPDAYLHRQIMRYTDELRALGVTV